MSFKLLTTLTVCLFAKVELSVYTANADAIALYERCGFEREGLIKKYRKLDGLYFDCVSMAKFLKSMA